MTFPAAAWTRTTSAPASIAPPLYWSGGILIISPSSTVNVSSHIFSDNQVGSGASRPRRTPGITR